MKITQTALPGVLLLTPRIIADNRGAFFESWSRRDFAEARLPQQWVQDNCSFSHRNVVRGIHYQVLQPQGKLVRAIQGKVLDVAVDLRRSSPNFGKSVAVELSAESGEALYIPVGFGHGFVALSDGVGMAYKVTDYHCPQGERTVIWNDSDLAIPWPIQEHEAILSDKDRNGTRFKEAQVFA